MAASRAVEPVATIFALRIGEALLLFTLGALAIHLTVSDVIFKNQAAFCTNFGITAVIGCLAARCRTNKNRMTGITPVFTTSHLFTNRTLLHQNTSINYLKATEHFIDSNDTARHKIIISQQNCQSESAEFTTKKPDLQGPAFLPLQRGEDQSTLKKATGPA